MTEPPKVPDTEHDRFLQRQQQQQQQRPPQPPDEVSPSAHKPTPPAEPVAVPRRKRRGVPHIEIPHMPGSAVAVRNSGWDVDTLREYIIALLRTNQELTEKLAEASDRRYEQRFKDSQTAVDAALTAARTAVDAALSAAKEAVNKAEMASEKRFESVNEFRATLSDQQRLLIPRTEAELRMNTAEGRIAVLELGRTSQQAHGQGAKDSWVLITGGVLFIISLIVFAMRFVT